MTLYFVLFFVLLQGLYKLHGLWNIAVMH